MRLYLTSLFIFITTIGFAQKSVKASYYHNKFEGRKTSSGSIYRADSLTCAHKTLPFGTRLRVENPENNFSVIVEVTDRGPFIKGREIDLSYAAAERIGIIEKGVAEVKISKLPEFKFVPPVIFDFKAIYFVDVEPKKEVNGIYDISTLFSQK